MKLEFLHTKTVFGKTESWVAHIHVHFFEGIFQSLICSQSDIKRLMFVQGLSIFHTYIPS